jgi:hypothetical protein
MFAILRWSVVAALIGIVVCVARDTGPPTDSFASALANALPGDPDAQAALRRRYGDNPACLFAIQKGMPGEFPSILRQAAQADRERKPAPLPDLAEMALDPTLSSEQREAFLHAHASVLEQFAGHPEAEAAYLDELKRVRVGAGGFADVRDDPVGVLVFGAVTDPGLRRYYLDQRDWLAEVLPELVTDDDNVTEPSESLSKTLADIGITAISYKEVVVHLELGSSGAALVLEHGPLLKACRGMGLPLDESLEAIFANPAFTENRPPDAVAADFRQVREHVPAV